MDQPADDSHPATFRAAGISSEVAAIAHTAVGAGVRGRTTALREELERLAPASRAAPRLGIHPGLLVRSVQNRWLSSLAEDIQAKVLALFKELDPCDTTLVGRHLRGRAVRILDDVDALHGVLALLTRLDTADPVTGADPVAPVQAYLRQTGVWAATALSAWWAPAPDQQATSRLAEPPVPNWEAVAGAFDKVQFEPVGKTAVVWCANAAVPFSDYGQEAGHWSFKPSTLERFGHAYGDLLGYGVADNIFGAGAQVLRLCLDAADPLLAHYAAREIAQVTRTAFQQNRDQVATWYLDFWTKTAPKVTDRGYEEQREFAAWEQQHNPRRLIGAHHSLLEAVGRPLLTSALHLQELAQSTGRPIDVKRPPATGELLERVAAMATANLVFALVTRCASGDVRNAGGHSGVVQRPGGDVQIEDGRGNVWNLNTNHLEFDHLMLRSLLIGIEAGLSQAPNVAEGFPIPTTRPAVEHTLASFEVAVRNTFQVNDVGNIDSLAWNAEGRVLVITVGRSVDRHLANAVMLQLLSTTAPATRPEQIEFRRAPRQLRWRSKAPRPRGL